MKINHVKSSHFFILITFFSLIFLVSCPEKKYEEIVFDNSYPLALAPDVSWAVVTDPYVTYKSEPDWSAEVKSHCRKGEILQVIGKWSDSKNEIWYYFENGWLPENSLAVYNNRYKAKSRASQLEN